MNLSRHTILLLAVLAVLVFAAPVAAQEDVLTRYDDEATRQLQEEYEAALQDEEKFLKTAPLGSWREDEKLANDLADARFRAIETAPEPEGEKAKATELRKKADSMESLQRFGDEAGTNIESDIYFGGAESKAEDYRREAEVHEAAAAAEEAATPEETSETSETTAAAAPGEGGEQQPVEEPEAAPEPTPEPETSSGPGFLSGLSNINLVPVIGFVALLTLAIFAFSRNAGMSIRSYLSPAMASVKKSPAKKKPSPKPKPKTAATTSKPANLEDEPEEAGSESSRRKTQKTSEPEDGSALVDRIRRMRDDQEPPTAEELNDMFNRPDAGDDG